MHQQGQLDIRHKQKTQKNVNIRIEELKMFAPDNQFKLYKNPQRYDEEETLNLQKMKTIAQLLMENKLTVIFHIAQLKLLNNLHYAFGCINTAIDPHLQMYTIKQEIELIVDNFASKINNFCKKQTTQNAHLFVNNLNLMFGKGKNENSKREILRFNSKFDRQNDQLDYFDKNTTNQATKSNQKLNKTLKKKKEQKMRQFISFEQQIDKLLSYHQNYLHRKS